MGKLLYYILKFIPRPDIVFILDVSPEVAIKRKAEHNLKEAETYCKLYRDLANSLKVECLNAEESFYKISNSITSKCSKYIINHGKI